MPDITRVSSFVKLELPNRTAVLPEDIVVRLPFDGVVDVDRVHLLAYIPWDDIFLTNIPIQHRDFFRFVLPHLSARTTNVHTALSVSHVPELIELTVGKVDHEVLYAAVILHDSGWARLSPEEIADSLDYTALAYSLQALKPKEAHATLGAEVARRLLKEYKGLNLSIEQKQYICDLVYHHDQVRPWPHDDAPIEYLLLGDADRLWSYTYENFWLDTIRKNIDSPTYVQNLENALEDFFLTEQGRTIARRLIMNRKDEVEQYMRQL
jgi:HD domain-containing protein